MGTIAGRHAGTFWSIRFGMKYGKEKGKRVDKLFDQEYVGVFFLWQVAAYRLVLYSVREQHGLELARRRETRIRAFKTMVWTLRLDARTQLLALHGLWQRNKVVSAPNYFWTRTPGLLLFVHRSLTVPYTGTLNYTWTALLRLCQGHICSK